MRAFVCIFAALYFCLPSRAMAWSQFGHLTVCDLAYRNLTQTSRDELNDILQSRSGGTLVRGRGRMEDRHYTSFNLGCLEEDALPRRNEFDHYLNLQRDTATLTDSCPPEANNGECILDGIRRDLAILSNRENSREDRVFALMALGHWIGDLHQPLHVSFGDDKGGGWISATLEGRCGSSRYRVRNLHNVWDNCIVEAGLFERVRQRADYRRSWSRYTVTYRAVDTLLANTSLAEERQIVLGEPVDWAQESFDIARSAEAEYCVEVDGICQYTRTNQTLERGEQRRAMVVSQDYLQRFDRIAEERLRRAGFRLAHLLNEALDPGYEGPVANGMQPG